MNVPDAVGVPLIVIVLLAKADDTPAGNPFAPDTLELEIPVAPVVLIVIAVKAVLMHKVGVEEGVPAELFGVTVMVADETAKPDVFKQLCSLVMDTNV